MAANRNYLNTHDEPPLDGIMPSAHMRNRNQQAADDAAAAAPPDRGPLYQAPYPLVPLAPAAAAAPPPPLAPVANYPPLPLAPIQQQAVLGVPLGALARHEELDRALAWDIFLDESREFERERRQRERTRQQQRAAAIAWAGGAADVAVLRNGAEDYDDDWAWRRPVQVGFLDGWLADDSMGSSLGDSSSYPSSSSSGDVQLIVFEQRGRNGQRIRFGPMAQQPGGNIWRRVRRASDPERGAAAFRNDFNNRAEVSGIITRGGNSNVRVTVNVPPGERRTRNFAFAAGGNPPSPPPRYRSRSHERRRNANPDRRSPHVRLHVSRPGERPWSRNWHPAGGNRARRGEAGFAFRPVAVALSTTVDQLVGMSGGRRNQGGDGTLVQFVRVVEPDRGAGFWGLGGGRRDREAEWVQTATLREGDGRTLAELGWQGDDGGSDESDDDDDSDWDAWYDGNSGNRGFGTPAWTGIWIGVP